MYAKSDPQKRNDVFMRPEIHNAIKLLYYSMAHDHKMYFHFMSYGFEGEKQLKV